MNADGKAADLTDELRERRQHSCARGFGGIDSWSTAGLVVEDVRANAGLRLRGHGHEQPHLCCIEAGSFEEVEPRGTRIARAGTVRVSPAGDEHDLVFGVEGARCTLVLIRGELADGTSPVAQHRRFVQDEAAAGLAGRLRRELAGPSSASPIAVELLVLELLARTVRGGRRRTRSSGRAPAWMEAVRQRLAEPSETGHDISALARTAGHHPVHVARAFRRWYGISPLAYARRLRLDRARRLVLHTDRPLARIALESGYSDQSHLTRSFRRWLGVSPASLRRGRPDVEEVRCVQDILD